MTAHHHLDLRRYPCGHCGASPGRPCRRPSGMTTAIEHADRFYAHQADQVWRLEHWITA